MESTYYIYVIHILNVYYGVLQSPYGSGGDNENCDSMLVLQTGIDLETS